MKASKHSARARRRYTHSDYPGYFLDGLRDKALQSVEMPTGKKPTMPSKGVYIRINAYASEGSSELRSDYFFTFASEGAAKKAVDHAIMCSS